MLSQLDPRADFQVVLVEGLKVTHSGRSTPSCDFRNPPISVANRLVRQTQKRTSSRGPAAAVERQKCAARLCNEIPDAHPGKKS